MLVFQFLHINQVTYSTLFIIITGFQTPGTTAGAQFAHNYNMSSLFKNSEMKREFRLLEANHVRAIPLTRCLRIL